MRQADVKPMMGDERDIEDQIADCVFPHNNDFQSRDNLARLLRRFTSKVRDVPRY